MPSTVQLMDIVYRGYTVPEAPGRVVSFGTSFAGTSYEPKKERVKRKYGSIMGIVQGVLENNPDWMSCRDIAEKVALSSPSVRNALLGLTEKHEVQSKLASNGSRVYRKI